MTNAERQQRYLANPVNREKKRHRDTVGKQSRKSRGLCLMCGERPSITNRKYCETCQQWSLDYARKRRVAFIAAGRCERCGKCEKLPNSLVCERCYFKKTSKDCLKSSAHWGALRDLFYAQGQRCSYTKRPLVLGVNASLDHIFPRSRFPELSTDPNNVEWVDRVVNTMKLNHTKEEFLLIVHEIHLDALGVNVGALMPSVA